MKFKTTALLAAFVVPLIPVLVVAQTTTSKPRVKKTRTPAETAAPAATPNSAAGTSRATGTRSNEQLAWLKARTNVAFLVNSASDFDLSEASLRTQGQKFDGGGNLGSSTAFGVEAQVIDYKWDQIGWFGAASIEQTREIATGNLNLGGNRQVRARFENKPTFRPLNVAGGLVYRLNDKIRFLGGANLTLIKQTTDGDFNSMSLDSKPGYQFGVAFTPTPRLALELTQKNYRYGFNARQGDDRIEATTASLSGITLTGRYSLE